LWRDELVGNFRRIMSYSDSHPSSASSSALPLVLVTIESQPFGENTYVLHRRDRRDCVVVDPGFDVEAIIRHLDEQSLTPVALLITHAHIDHIAGNGGLKERWPSCPIIIGRGDAPKLTDPRGNLSGLYDFNLTSPPADQLLDDEECVTVAGLEFWTRNTPGHSSGHVVFVVRAQSPWLVFGGDVLFHGSIGRTDFPGGSFEVLRHSIHDKLFTLPDDTIVLPGHGPPTTITREKRLNRFVAIEK
jgi:hydroxyacylglutathione hydrolase